MLVVLSRIHFHCRECEAKKKRKQNEKKSFFWIEGRNFVLFPCNFKSTYAIFIWWIALWNRCTCEALFMQFFDFRRKKIIFHASHVTFDSKVFIFPRKRIIHVYASIGSHSINQNFMPINWYNWLICAVFCN